MHLLGARVVPEFAVDGDRGGQVTPERVGRPRHRPKVSAALPRRAGLLPTRIRRRRPRHVPVELEVVDIDVGPQYGRGVHHTDHSRLPPELAHIPHHALHRLRALARGAVVVRHALCSAAPVEAPDVGVAVVSEPPCLPVDKKLNVPGGEEGGGGKERQQYTQSKMCAPVVVLTFPTHSSFVDSLPPPPLIVILFSLCGALVDALFEDVAPSADQETDFSAVDLKRI